METSLNIVIIETVREVGDIPVIVEIRGPEIRIRASRIQKAFKTSKKF